MRNDRTGVSSPSGWHCFYHSIIVVQVKCSNISSPINICIFPIDLYLVAREKNTERPFTGKYWKSNTKGTYYCAACGNILFKSDAKFASSCGWPSFYEPLRKNSVVYQEDNSHEMSRTEVLCGRCDAHLGHIFDDGPAPTYKRFCMNSISLDFEEEESKK